MAAKKKYEVLQLFRDKETKNLYNVGEEYEPKSKERADYLLEYGYITEVTEEQKDSKEEKKND
ncbi:hypothetical protein BCV73_08855 [Paenibacillus sp. SSG-1]|uniref:hypothetical protein n=1 Tax=Paenibacillus sp. SSG-1 TaxID=1443669 RepID=UPI000B7CB657|nr:hypothetical protein [Paenibacillus sp. SSG-1]OXL83174.1 hypothetical protein BCV73_08855 [Paenibacillus sp. SSG-1]